MTRPFNIKYQCHNCGCMTTAETGFGRWLRENKSLDSKEAAVVCNDVDYIVHKYKTHEGRQVQCLMFVEVKTNGADMSPQQRDTQGLVYQFLNNRRQNIHKSKPLQVDGRPRNAKSLMTGLMVDVRSFGVHLLQFEKTGPHDSEWIKWDRVDISEHQLVGLLRFDLDPDSLGPLDLRLHHARGSRVQEALFSA